MDFKPFHCSRLDHAPYVSNAYENRSFCPKEHAVYSAHKAEAKNREWLSDTRRALHTPNENIAELNDLIAPIILNGQSLNHIYANHSGEICVARRTLYDYIDKCAFDVWNIDLPHKVRYKKRRKKRSEPAPCKYHQGRTYEDFKEFIKRNPDLNVVEMDTVKGRREKGKCLLTMNFVQVRHFARVYY